MNLKTLISLLHRIEIAINIASFSPKPNILDILYLLITGNPFLDLQSKVINLY